MESKGDISEFNALIAGREGPERKKQEVYIVRVLMALVAERSNGGAQPSDDISVLKALGLDDADKVFATLKEAKDKTIYSAVAKLLLDDSSDKWDIVRVAIEKHMQAAINRDEKNQQGTNI